MVLISDLEEKAWKLAHLVYAPAALVGEGMQVATVFKVSDYNFLTGHLSDFALAGYFTALGIAFTEGKSRIAQLGGATLPAALLTLREYFPIVPFESVTDPVDTACYVAAAVLTTALLKHRRDELRTTP